MKIECHPNYTLKNKDTYLVFRYRVDMENHTGWDVQIVMYNSFQVGISIDRKGHFVFKGWDAILGMKNKDYIAEKLFLCDSDAEHMITFFEWFYNTDLPMCYRLEAWNH